MAETAETTESNALRTLREIVGSGRPLVYIRSPEEHRVSSLVNEIATTFFPSPVPLWTWSLTEGMRGTDGAADGQPFGARAALDFVVTHDGPGVFLLRDFHEPMRESAEIRRRLRDLYGACLDRGKFVFICSPVKVVPEEIERDISYLELALPDLPELIAFLREQAASIKAVGRHRRRHRRDPALARARAPGPDDGRGAARHPPRAERPRRARLRARSRRCSRRSARW